MRATITTKLAILGGTGMVLLTALAGASVFGLRTEHDAATQLAASSLVMRDAALVDMFHDATYGGVQRIIVMRLKKISKYSITAA